MLKSRAAVQRGDTLIEVLVAMAVLSVVMVGVFGAMGSAERLAYSSMERSQVRALLNKQLEIVSYYRDRYFEFANKKKLDATITAPTPGSAEEKWQKNIQAFVPSGGAISAANVCSNVKGYYFKLPSASDTQYSYYELTAEQIKPAGSLPTPGDGMWIESRREPSSGNKVGYVDIAVKACWYAASGSQIEQMSSLMRLYDQN